MQIVRDEHPCRACRKPVGVWFDAERYERWEQQWPHLVPMCNHCAELCVEADVGPVELGSHMRPTDWSSVA